jgi:hypothetical protein
LFQHVPGSLGRGFPPHLPAKAFADILSHMERADDFPRGVPQGTIDNLPAGMAQSRITERLHHGEGFAGQGSRHQFPQHRALLGQEKIWKNVPDPRRVAVDAKELVIMRLVEGDQTILPVEDADRGARRPPDHLPNGGRISERRRRIAPGVRLPVHR